MANSFFQFKQFKIEQDKCGMKVTTDGCYFGSIFTPYKSGRILDIGTGTGLLALMAAQRTEATINAIEVNLDAYQQARINFSNSPWADQLSVAHTALQTFRPAELYNQIICNPPFFANSQHGQSNNKNQALHAHSLSMEDLVNHALRLMENDGEFWVMYPDSEMKQFTEIAIGSGLKPQSRFILRNKKNEVIFRQIVIFCKTERNLKSTSDVYIKEQDGSYSKLFTEALKDFYLHL